MKPMLTSPQAAGDCKLFDGRSEDCPPVPSPFPKYHDEVLARSARRATASAFAQLRGACVLTRSLDAISRSRERIDECDRAAAEWLIK